jgi:hypothetical protein
LASASRPQSAGYNLLATCFRRISFPGATYAGVTFPLSAPGVTGENSTLLDFVLSLGFWRDLLFHVQFSLFEFV